ncbi:TonB-dependent receptor domain-containing protein [Hyphococcus luteus]|nr:TonB-dependent receptor [Marinicaulis flavus]
MTTSAAAIMAAWSGAALAQDEPDDQIVVTGSRISTLAIDAPAPVAVFDTELLVQNTGSISVGDELADLPQFSATGNQAASAGIESNSQVGLNLLDLRGLGPSRTLVLVNGRRHVSSSQETAQPDTNTIPAGLLERVEVLTGGASAVYGADAVAGVVNFVLDDDFEGVKGVVRGGVSDEKDAESFTANLTLGKNFADGRGNIAADLEYSRNASLYYTDRAFSAVQTSFAPDFSANPPYTYRLVEDLRLLSTSTGGTLIDAMQDVYRFAPDGSLNPADFGKGSLIPFGPIISEGGDGLNSVEDQTLLPSLERMGLNLLAHYELTDKARLFFEGKVVNIESSATSQPVNAGFVVSVDNPYLTQQARDLLTGSILPMGTDSFSISRMNRDFGTPQVNNERLTMRGLVGVEGEFADRFNYEFSYGYGRTETDSVFTNNVVLARLQYAADAVVDGAGVLGSPGAIVCNATLMAGSTSTGDAAIDECQPANIFGEGAVSDAARDYVTFTSRADGLLTQHVLGGYVSGDTAGLIDLPGGPIQMVVGGEFRREETSFNPDPRDLAGGTSRAGIQPVNGSFNVVEGYAEASAPLLADQPLAELLEINGAVRVAHYNLEGVGANISWGVGGVYSPVPDIRFRGAYQRAVRAPNLAELYAPITPVQFSVFDPCDASAINDGPAQRAANCAALGAPAGFTASTIGGLVPGTTGGNPNLDVEHGTTWTVGAVFTPSIAPGFVLSVDYYDIKLDDAIATTNASTILRLCVDSASVNNAFCDLVTRDAASFDVTFITEGATNINSLTARGIDFDARYGFALPVGELNLRAVASYVLERNNFLDPFAPSVATEILRDVGTPKTRVNLSTSYDVNKFRFSYNMRYFSGAIRSFAGGRLQEGALPPDILYTGGTFIHDISARYEASEQATVFFGVDNLFEADLPPGVYGAGFGGANYDAIGRYFYGGVSFAF